ncbi:hypothetical protein CPB84DRAFT_1969337 [Gymnopilus junonius]|uniref:Uncharacterized protein n=1 Tax=Gymnopilus junonius TaxID=109634 RepID=A0A9P5N7S8_GYMJU|nr:hypothetical protein CPB84DRAFT_1969337 [Gymnopilus junonius]
MLEVQSFRNSMVQATGGYYLTRDQVREYAKRENVNLQAVVNQPDIFSLLAIEHSIEKKKGFQDVKVIGTWYPRGSLRKLDDQEPTDVFLFVMRWRMECWDIVRLSDAKPFEENDHDHVVKAQMTALGITETRFITVPDPDHEFIKMGDYVSNDNDSEEGCCIWQRKHESVEYMLEWNAIHLSRYMLSMSRSPGSSRMTL